MVIGKYLLGAALVLFIGFGIDQAAQAPQKGAPPNDSAPPANRPTGPDGARGPGGAPGPAGIPPGGPQGPAGVTQRRPNAGARARRRPTSGFDPAVVERGQTAFVSQCAFCHGSNAKGGEGGPDLIRSVLVLDDENGNEIGQVILNGRPAKGMPKFSMSQAQIIEIATFLHQRVFDAAQRGSYKILNIVTGDPQKGKQYFDGAGKCATCHSADGDLKGIASKYDPPTLETKFLMPRGRGFFGPPEPEKKPITALITLPSGKSFDGKLEHIDDFNVVLITPDGEYHSFDRNGDTPKVEIHDPLKAHYDMLTKYKDSDIHNLTAYLETVK